MPDVGLVLAAGRSSRFGPENKLLAPFHGQPLASYAAQAMAAVPLAHRIVVVGSEDVAPLFDGYEIVMLDNRETGQSDSLHAGLTAAEQSGATRLLVMLGDMPFVTAAHLGEVLNRGTEGISASYDGVRPMPPACFPRSAFPVLREVSGDKGAGALLRTLPDQQLIRAPALLIDIDTPEALTAALTHSSQ